MTTYFSQLFQGLWQEGGATGDRHGDGVANKGVYGNSTVEVLHNEVS